MRLHLSKFGILCNPSLINFNSLGRPNLTARPDGLRFSSLMHVCLWPGLIEGLSETMWDDPMPEMNPLSLRKVRTAIGLLARRGVTHSARIFHGCMRTRYLDSKVLRSDEQRKRTKCEATDQ